MKLYKKIMADGSRSKNWYVQYTLNGKQRPRCTKQSNKADAEKWVKKYILPYTTQDTEEGLISTIKEMSTDKKVLIEDAWQNDLDSLDKKKESGKTHLKNKNSRWHDFEHYAVEIHNVKYMHEINEKVAEGYIRLIRKSGRYNKRFKGVSISKLAPKTLNDLHKAATEVCNTYFNKNRMFINPFININKLSEDNESREIYTDEELKLMFENATGYIRHILIVGYYTGMRKGDICTLEWSNLKTGWIKRVLRKTKGKITVEFPLDELFLNHLKTLKKDSKYLSLLLAKMYSTAEGRSKISRDFKVFLDILGIVNQKKVKGRDQLVSTKDIHSLRHQFITIAAEAGMPEAVLRSIVGHMTESMTATYTKNISKKAKIRTIPNKLGLPEVQKSDDHYLNEFEKMSKEQKIELIKNQIH